MNESRLDEAHHRNLNGKQSIKFGKLDENGKFYLPLNAKGKTQSGTKDSMVVVFDGRNEVLLKIEYAENLLPKLSEFINKKLKG